MITGVDLDALIAAAGLEHDHVRDLARRTLAEDLQWGPDVTTAATIPATQQGRADVVARQPGTIAGIPLAVAVMEAVASEQGATLAISVARTDSDRVETRDTVMTVAGPLPAILTGERSLLNFLGQLSGVATLTAAWARQLDGTHCRVRDTRKTVPGLRILQKYAVRCGGGVNHRMGLGDAALIKDNHIAAAGSVAEAFAAVRAKFPTVPCEIECDSLEQVQVALDAGADLILLDNFVPAHMAEAVALAKPYGVRLEASGGLTLPDAAEVASTGVDFIAVGELTHSAKVLDLGLDLVSDKPSTPSAHSDEG